MAMLAGIGRALTSLGTDMTRQREEREDRERRLSDLKEARAYDTTIRDQQARIRADETQANRDWSLDQTRAQRDWTMDEADRQAAGRAEALSQQNLVADRRSAETNRLADERLAGAQAREDQFHTAGREAMTDIMRSGELNESGRALLETRDQVPPLLRRPFERGVDTYVPDPGSYAALQRVNYEVPTTEGPSAGRESALYRSVADAAKILNDEGFVTGYSKTPYEIDQMVQMILQSQNPDQIPGATSGSFQYNVPEPPQSLIDGSIPVPGGGGLGTRNRDQVLSDTTMTQVTGRSNADSDTLTARQPRPVPSPAGGTTGRGQPTVDREAFEIARTAKNPDGTARFTQEELDDMLGGPFNPYGDAGRVPRTPGIYGTGPSSLYPQYRR